MFRLNAVPRGLPVELDALGISRPRGQLQSKSEKRKQAVLHKFSVSKKKLGNLSSTSCICQRKLAANLIIRLKEFSRSGCAM